MPGGLRWAAIPPGRVGIAAKLVGL